jgi:hypothetical protein
MPRKRPRQKLVRTGPSKKLSLQFNGGGPLEVSQAFYGREIFIDVASLRMAMEGENLGNVGDDLKKIAASYLRPLEGLSAEINTIPHDTAPTKAKKPSLAEEAFEELNSWLQEFTKDKVINRIPYCNGEFEITLECIHKSLQLIACAVHCVLALLATLIMQQKFDQEVLVPLASKKNFKNEELTALLQRAECITIQGVNDAKKFTLILSEGSVELGIIDTDNGAKVSLSKYIKSVGQWIEQNYTSCPDELDKNFKLMKTIVQTFQRELDQALAEQEELVKKIFNYISNTNMGTADDDDSGNNSEKNRKRRRLEGAGEGPKKPAPPDESMNAGGSSENAKEHDKFIWLD